MKLLVLACLLLAAPAAAQEACPFPGQTPMLVTQLFFGQSRQGTALISRRAWQRFVADTITPAFPDGFTILDATGQYRDPTGAVAREPTEVLVVAAPDGPALRARLAAIMAAFRQRFDQRSVGIVTTPACAGF